VRLIAPEVVSAQRLAASPEKSHFDMECDLGISLCSTPRGITGKIAKDANRVIAGLDCAQRLAASPEKSLNASSITSRSSIRAQRLAASPEKSPGGTTIGGLALLVLNASRHHRKNRPSVSWS